MTNEQKIAIGEFFAAAEKLRELGVVRSDRYLGDIAEFLASTRLDFILADGLRQKGHDGNANGRKIEVKYNGGKSTTLLCGNPDTYDELVVVLGPNSVMRRKELTAPYLFYRIPSAVVKTKDAHADGVRRLVKGNLAAEYLVDKDVNC